MPGSGVPAIRMLWLHSSNGRSGSIWNAMKVRLVGSSSSVQTIPSPPGVMPQTPSVDPVLEDTGSKWSSHSLDLALRRKEYEAKVSNVRKKYMQEMQRKKAEEMRAEHVKRQVILKAKEERLAVKKERSEERAFEVQKESETLTARYGAEKALKATQREKLEKKILLRKQRQIEKIRQESVNWIEKNDLELRILEAMSDPIRLTGPFQGVPSPVPLDNVGKFDDLE